MTKRIIYIVIFCWALVQPLSAVSLDGDITPVGTWEGTIQIPQSPLGVTVNLNYDDGELSGTVDIPLQNAFGLQLEKLSFDGENIRFSISGIPGDPTFNGRFESENRITGNFTQAGQSFPFYLEREDAEEAWLNEEKEQAFFERLRQTMHESLEIWNIPGAAVAIVRDNKVVFNEGFGYRDLENQLPVTARTQFAIGSSSKAFTGLTAALLEEDGLLDLHKPIIDYVPEFRMYDDFTTQRMSMTDLLTHRSGLPRHDLAWYGSDRDREALFKALRYLEPTYDLRVQFQYQNLMYLAAGVVIERLTGKTWEEFTRERIFEPAGIKEANFSVTDMQKAADFSYPYTVTDGKPERVPFRSLDAIGPAGSINASTDDMVQWVKVLLNNGENENGFVAEPATMSNLFMVHTPIAGGGREMKNIGYSLGWFNRVYRGHSYISHDGGIDGFLAYVGLLPDSDIGFVILTNNDANPVRTFASRVIADFYLNLDPIDWLERFRPDEDGEQPDDAEPEMPEEQEAVAELPDADLEGEEGRISGTSPSFALSDYTGVYTHGGYGTMEIKKEGDKLFAHYNGFEVELKHWHFDVFRGEITAGASMEMLIHFKMDENGRITSLTAPLNPGFKPIEFERAADPRFSSRAYLEAFTGSYKLDPQTVVFSIRGERLQAAITGQPPFFLEPLAENLFMIENMEAFRVRFEFSDDNGEEAVKAVFIQPNGTFVMERIKD